MRRTDPAVVEPELVKKLEQTFYIKKLPTECNFGVFYDCWDRADDVKRHWPKLRSQVEGILTAKNDEDLKNYLYETTRGVFF